MPVSLLADTCTQLGYQAESGPWRNFCLTGARELLKSDIPYTSQLINDGVIAQMDMDMLLDYCAIQIDGEKAAGKDAVINIRFTDTGDKVSLILANGVLNHRMDRHEKDADLTLEVGKMDFVKLFFGQTDSEALRESGKLRMSGDSVALDELCGCFEPSDPNFRIVLP